MPKPAPQRNGPGWAEAARSKSALQAHFLYVAERTVHWERPLSGTSPEAAMELRLGPTAAAISGFMAARAPSRFMTTRATPWAYMLSGSMTFGSSILTRTNGPGWAEAAVNMTRPERTARWACLLPETSPEAARELQVGPIAAAISGFLVARTLVFP